MKNNEVMINGTVYVPKDSVKPKATGNMLIVRTRSAGVHYGYGKLDKATATIELKNSRRMWMWSGANCLSQLATTGTKDPSNCKFSAMVPSVTLLEVTEVIPCTKEAEQILSGIKEWVKE